MNGIMFKGKIGTESEKTEEFHIKWMHKVREGAAIAQVDSSVPTILPSQVRVPSTPSTLLSFIEFVLYLSCEKNENKEKKGGIGPF